MDVLDLIKKKKNGKMKKQVKFENRKLKELRSRMQGWQLNTFEESYNHKIKHGISLLKKKFRKIIYKSFFIESISLK